MARTLTHEKETAILEAAAAVFAGRDFHEVLTEEIAAAAGIGKGTIYRYFPTKEALYVAAILHGFHGLNEHLASVVSRVDSPVKRLERIAREILTFFWDRRDLYSLIVRSEYRLKDEERKMRHERGRLVALVQETIVTGIARREFRGVNPRIGAELFLGMIRNANYYRQGGDTIASLTHEILLVFTKGIEREARG